MLHKNNNLNIEQKIIINFFKMIKWIFVTLFNLFRQGKKVYTNKNNNNAIKDLDKKQLEEIGNRWREIEDLINLGGISQMKQGLLEADKLVDYLLRKKQIKGSTFGERLKASEQIFSATVYNNLWEAHKLRNSLAHDVDKEIFHWQIKEAIKNYKQAIMETGAL